MQLTFDSADDLARALRRAADAHHQHEEQTGRPDPDWPHWYALYLEREQAGPERVPAFPDRLDGATVPVAVVTSRTEAELIVGMLRNNDLRAAVSADDAGGLEPELQMQGVRVLVAPSDEAPARRLLAAAAGTSRRPVSPAPFSGGPAGSPVPEGANRWP
jgi:phosphoglycolate phosphatase-like HAD superfamily hydrolase